MEASQKRDGTKLPSTAKFDPNKKICISADAPPPARDYDVTYDPKIGLTPLTTLLSLGVGRLLPILLAFILTQ